MFEGGSTMTETGSSVAGVTEEWLATAVVRESAEAIVVTDPAGIIRLWNDGTARMFGYPVGEAIGQNLLSQHISGSFWVWIWSREKSFGSAEFTRENPPLRST